MYVSILLTVCDTLNCTLRSNTYWSHRQPISIAETLWQGLWNSKMFDQLSIFNGEKRTKKKFIQTRESCSKLLFLLSEWPKRRIWSTKGDRKCGEEKNLCHNVMSCFARQLSAFLTAEQLLIMLHDTLNANVSPRKLRKCADLTVRPL